MPWIKDVLIDIAITILIVLAALSLAPWAKWVVYIYTPFMVLLKVFALSGSGIKNLAGQQSRSQPPEWFFHLLYGINVVILAIAQWWIWAGLWLIIWVLSFVAARR